MEEQIQEMREYYNEISSINMESDDTFYIIYTLIKSSQILYFMNDHISEINMDTRELCHQLLNVCNKVIYECENGINPTHSHHENFSSLKHIYEELNKKYKNNTLQYL